MSNASTGKMGYALARAAIKAGHKVTLITGPTALRPPKGAKVVNVETGAQMFEAVKKHFAKCDFLIMAAAVADYTPAKKSKIKIKKDAGPVTLKLKALEDKSIRKNAEKKLKDKNLDMIIANRPAAIGTEKTTVQIKTSSSKWLKLPHATKLSNAKRIVHLIEKLTV